MKSIVTGGAGFIGSHIVDKLLEMGHDVIVIDNASATEHDQFYWNVRANNYPLDITREWQRKVLPLFKDVNYVFHCAAEARIQPAINQPVKTVNTNVLGTSIVLQCAREAGCKRVIFSSSSSIYGSNNKVPFVETMPADCLNPYSESKLAAERLCAQYSSSYALDTVSLRYFNVYGPREPIRGSHAPIVGKFLKQKQNGEPLTVVGDGSQRRDFTHVDDVVFANILAMFSSNNFYGQIFNVGTGKNYSVLEVAQLISNNIAFVPRRAGEAFETLASIEKINSTLGWSPSIHLTDYIARQV